MIAIKPKYHSRKYCYGGSGIFDVLKKVISKTASSAVAQKVINAATSDGLKTIAKSTVAHKFADAVVNGATSATQKAVENAIIDTLRKRKASTSVEYNKKIKIDESLKRKLSDTTTTNGKKLKIDISNLINGSGIVLD